MPVMRVVRAAILQAKWTGDTSSMIEVHEAHARAAAEQGAQVMGFQEVFNAPYFCQVQEPEHFAWAEQVPDGPTVVRMQALARETGMVLVVPFSSARAPATSTAPPSSSSATAPCSPATASTTFRR